MYSQYSVRYRHILCSGTTLCAASTKTRYRDRSSIFIVYIRASIPFKNSNTQLKHPTGLSFTGIGLEGKARPRGRNAQYRDKRLRGLALSSAWSIVHLVSKNSLIICVRRLCLYEINVSDHNVCVCADGIPPFRC